jgi:hypothetical protein
LSLSIERLPCFSVIFTHSLFLFYIYAAVKGCEVAV